MEHILSTEMGNYSGKKFCLKINAAKVTRSEYFNQFIFLRSFVWFAFRIF